MTDLKPCPFCGRKDATTPFPFHPQNGANVIACRGCGAEGPDCATPEDAAERWNTRFSDGITLKPLEFEYAERYGYKERIMASAFGWKYFICADAKKYYMVVYDGDWFAFYQVECADATAATKAANAHFAAHIAEWMEADQ